MSKSVLRSCTKIQDFLSTFSNSVTFYEAQKSTYTEKVCWPGGVQGPPIPLLLMLRVKTTIDKEFPIRPMPETTVKRMPSMIKVKRLCSSSIVLP